MDCVLCSKPGVSMESKFLCPGCSRYSLDVLKKAKCCVFCASTRVGWENRIDEHPVFGDMSFAECKSCNSNGPIVTGGVQAAVDFWNMGRCDGSENPEVTQRMMSSDFRKVSIDWGKSNLIHVIEAPGAKPCPRCLSADVWLFHLCDSIDESWFVVCKNCSGTGPIADIGSAVTAPVAIKFWNERLGIK